MSTQTDYKKIEKSARLRSRSLSTATYAFLTIWAVMVLFPFYWMLLTSVKSYSAYNSEFIPKLYTLSPTLQNYLDAFTAVPLADYFVNTLIFTLSTTAVMLIVTVLAAFAFARLKFKGQHVLFALFLSLVMVFTVSFSALAETAAEEPAAEEVTEEPAPEVVVSENEPVAAEEDFAE